MNSFVLRLMGLRERIVSLSKEEGCPYEQQTIQKRFLYSLSTGLKSENLRQSLQHLFCNTKISDEDLLSEISYAEAKEAEHNEKLLNQVAHKNSSRLELSELTSKLNELDHFVRHHFQNNRETKGNPSEQPSVQRSPKYFPAPSHAASRPYAPPPLPPPPPLSFFPRSHYQNPSNRQSSFPPRYQQPFPPAVNHRRPRQKCVECQRLNIDFCDHCFRCGKNNHIAAECTQKQK